MFVAISRFTVANDKSEEVRRAFLARPRLVEKAPGFVRMDVLRSTGGDEFWLLTYWRDEDSFKVWHHGHTYRESHKHIPKGLKLVKGSVELHHLEHVCS